MTDTDRRYYFDANALWKFYRDEQGDLNIRRLVANSTYPILVSPLTRLEVVGVLMKDFRQGYLKRKVINKITERLIRDIKPEAKAHRFAITNISESSFQLAESILVQHAGKFGIGSNDSLHLAVMIKLQSTIPAITFVTSDKPLQRVCEKMSLAFYDPENVDTTSN